MPLVITGLKGRRTHTQKDSHTDVCTETILRNHVCASLWLVCMWFNDVKIFVDYLKKMKLSNYKLFSHENIQATYSMYTVQIHVHK